MTGTVMRVCRRWKEEHDLASADAVGHSTGDWLQEHEDQQCEEADDRCVFLGNSGGVHHVLLHVGGEDVEGNSAADGEGEDGYELLGVLHEGPEGSDGLGAVFQSCGFAAFSIL